MPSSKGKPTDPKLREEIKEKVKNEPNSDGQGKGQWSAWKATKLSKEYEKQGGGYENDPGSKNEPKKGAPEPKKEEEKAREVEQAETQQNGNSGKHASKDTDDKPKANTGKKATSKGTPFKQSSSSKKEKKAPREGTRRSSRVGAKRDAEAAGATSANGSKKQKP